MSNKLKLQVHKTVFGRCGFLYYFFFFKLSSGAAHGGSIRATRSLGVVTAASVGSAMINKRKIRCSCNINNAVNSYNVDANVHVGAQC